MSPDKTRVRKSTLRHYPVLFGIALFAIWPQVCVAADAPAVYAMCRNCHNYPGSIGPRSAPDLSESTYTLDQFRNQLMNGSKWPGKPPKKQKYRWKEMPPQIGLAEKQIVELYGYIVKSR
ncbi:MAG: hypothetical protein HY751_13990 [Nitrospinae bacterium]|nr:hypothetical protein [Nitrospinota bacterium]